MLTDVHLHSWSASGVSLTLSRPCVLCIACCRPSGCQSFSRSCGIDDCPRRVLGIGLTVISLQVAVVAGSCTLMQRMSALALRVRIASAHVACLPQAFLCACMQLGTSLAAGHANSLPKLSTLLATCAACTQTRPCCVLDKATNAVTPLTLQACATFLAVSACIAIIHAMAHPAAETLRIIPGLAVLLMTQPNVGQERCQLLPWLHAGAIFINEVHARTLSASPCLLYWNCAATCFVEAH